MSKRARSDSYNVVSYQSQPMDTQVSKGRFLATRRRSFKKTRQTALNKTINQAISRRLETKEYVDFGANQSIISASLTVAPAQKYLLPVITQGLGQASRIGNQIKIRSGILRLRFNLTANSFNVSNQSPALIRVWIVSYKVENTNLLGSPDFNSFFETGNSSVDFQSNMLDTLLPVSGSNWTVYYDKVHKVGLGAISSSNTNGTYPDNSTFTQELMIDWGQHFKSPLEYDDQLSASVPRNRNCFVLLQSVKADGTSNSEGESYSEFHYVNTVKYEDA